jgi:uncharacterized membrane protein
VQNVISTVIFVQEWVHERHAGYCKINCDMLVIFVYFVIYIYIYIYIYIFFCICPSSKTCRSCARISVVSLKYFLPLFIIK